MIEAVVLGRVGVDITPTEPRTSLAAAATFIRAVGGFAGNIGTGLARLGIQTAVVSGVGADGHGEHVRAALAGEGIDVAALLTMPEIRTQVAFFEAWPPDRFPVTFYRPAPAPDTLLEAAEVPMDLLVGAPLMIVSGALLAADPARTTVIEVLERRAAGSGLQSRSWTILDLDWRPSLWPDPADYPGLIARAASLGDVVIGSDDEFAAARLRPQEAVDMVRGASGSSVVVVKHGPAGASVLTDIGRRSVPGVPVDVVCGLGAGDALTAAFGAGVLRGLDPFAALERGNAAGAIVASRLMCSSAMPAPSEIDGLLAGPMTAAGESRA